MANRFALPFALLALSCSKLLAQSLDIHHPAVLKHGVTASQIDAFTGAHHYVATVGPGTVVIAVSFRANSILSATIRTILTVQLWDLERTTKSEFNLVSAGDTVSHSFQAELAGERKMLLDIIPPHSVVRLGGPYEISFTGAGQESPDVPSSADPLTLHRYRWFTGCPGTDQACTGIRFNADGSFTVPGDRGVWKVFDRESNIYTLVWADMRESLKYMPGRGLVEINKPEIVVFKELP
jgi:hypothetical protein